MNGLPSITRLSAALIVAFALTLAAAPSALADTTNSANWAGYAAHRSGVAFKKVSGYWRQPEVTCTPSNRTYSSVWVGLGGFKQNANALEQIGSEVDCNARGEVVSSAWYEVVPAPSRPIRMKVSPGDQLNASVTVVGHTVKMTLKDLTRGKTFSRTVKAKTVDLSSADWIVEAPSECRGSFCRLLPLANFGSATFTRSGAVATRGRFGYISDRRWNATRITLSGGGRHFINQGSANAVASTSPLMANGRSFTVTYTALSNTTTPAPVVQGSSPSSTALARSTR